MKEHKTTFLGGTRSVLVLAGLIMAGAARSEASIVADVQVNTGFRHADATGNAAWGFANDHFATALPGLPPTFETTGTDNAAAARGRTFDANLGVFALSLKGDASGLTVFNDQIQIMGPLTIDLDLVIEEIGFDHLSTTMTQGRADAAVTLSFELRDGPQTVAAAALDVGGSKDFFGRQEAWSIVQDGQLIASAPNLANSLHHSFTFTGQPGITYDVEILMLAQTRCLDVPNPGDCFAIADAYNSGGVRFTGDYVSLGGSTYPGLSSPSTVPEPTSFVLLGGGLLLVAMSKLQRARRNYQDICRR